MAAMRWVRMIIPFASVRWRVGGEAFDHPWVGERLLKRGRELPADRLRRALGRPDGAPGRKIEALDAAFRKRREIGQDLDPFARGDSVGFDLAGLDLVGGVGGL